MANLHEDLAKHISAIPDNVTSVFNPPYDVLNVGCAGEMDIVDNGSFGCVAPIVHAVKCLLVSSELCHYFSCISFAPQFSLLLNLVKGMIRFT